MKKRLFTMFLFSYLLFSFSLVLAQDTPKSLFSQMDADKDGKVTSDEFMAVHMESARTKREARFNQLDTNKDGKITSDEFMAVQMEEARRIGKVRFNRIDRNKDRMLSEKEVIRRFDLIKQTLEQLK